VEGVRVSYTLEINETPGAGLQRVIAEQARKLRREAPIGNSDPAAFVHKARVRCKRIRAALRLARPLMSAKAFRRENHWWRDTGRGLSDLRDMSARVEALDAMATFLRANVGVAPVANLHERFAEQHAAYARKYEAVREGEHPVAVFCAAVAGRHAHELSIQDGTFDDIAATMGDSYGAARTAMKAAFADGSAPAFHEWRKRAKLHALQLRLMRRLPGAALGDRMDQTRDLSEMLGAVQDISILMLALRGKEEAAIGELLGARMNELTGMAGAAGAHLFGLKRKAWLAEVIRPTGAKPEEDGGDAKTAARHDAIGEAGDSRVT
jgi:CHAD domain-containing protein